MHIGTSKHPYLGMHTGTRSGYGMVLYRIKRVLCSNPYQELHLAPVGIYKISIMGHRKSQVARIINKYRTQKSNLGIPVLFLTETYVQAGCNRQKEQFGDSSTLVRRIP
jgi:hypothetical protein